MEQTVPVTWDYWISQLETVYANLYQQYMDFEMISGGAAQFMDPLAGQWLIYHNRNLFQHIISSMYCWEAAIALFKLIAELFGELNPEDVWRAWNEAANANLPIAV